MKKEKDVSGEVLCLFLAVFIGGLPLAAAMNYESGMGMILICSLLILAYYVVFKKSSELNEVYNRYKQFVDKSNRDANFNAMLDDWAGKIVDVKLKSVPEVLEKVSNRHGKFIIIYPCIATLQMVFGKSEVFAWISIAALCVVLIVHAVFMSSVYDECEKYDNLLDELK